MTNGSSFFVNFAFRATFRVKYGKTKTATMIEILRLRGREKKLYQLVAPLVMDPEVLHKNNNYPFKTTDAYVWFIAVADKKVIGFIPVEVRSKMAIINNYYVDEKEDEALSLLISAIISDMGDEKRLSSVTLAEDRAAFEKLGFMVEKVWKRYVKMCKG